MLKEIYKYTLLLSTVVLASCSSENITDKEQGDKPISLHGVVSRATGDYQYLTGYNSLYLTAMVTPTNGTETYYFSNEALTIGNKISGKIQNELGSDVYYPLSNKSLKLYSHTADSTSKCKSMKINS